MSERPEAPRRKAGRPTRVQSERTNAQVLEAATEVFIALGYAGASIDRIASVAGIGKPTIYARFGSKENLLKEVIDFILNKRMLALRGEGDASDAEDGLKDILARIIELATGPLYVGIFRLFLREANNFPEIFDAFYETTEMQSKRPLIAHLKSHDQFNGLKLTPDQVATAMLDMANSLVVMSSAKPEYRETLSAQLEAARIVDIILHGCM